MKLSDAAPSGAQRGRENKFEGGPRQGHQQHRSNGSQGASQSGSIGQGAMASAFAKLQNKG
jgi:hypothetical protein